MGKNFITRYEGEQFELTGNTDPNDRVMTPLQEVAYRIASVLRAQTFALSLFERRDPDAKYFTANDPDISDILD